MSQEEHLFVSDVHLGAFPSVKEKEVENQLIFLINYAIEKNAYLYILGDLFDYWMEYPDKNFVPDIGKNVLDKFEEYNNQVRPAIYVTGNHDNWTFGHFKNRGFDVEPTYRIIKVGETNVLIMHGDGLVGERDDIFRPLFHKILRHSLFTKFYQKLLPPKLGLSIMKGFSNLTRKRNHDNPKPLTDNARKILSSNKIDLVISGHDHLPRVETFSDGMYINLGTFFKHKTLARYTENEFNLVSWHVDNKEFVPYRSNKSQV